MIISILYMINTWYLKFAGITTWSKLALGVSWNDSSWETLCRTVYLGKQVWRIWCCWAKVSGWISARNLRQLHLSWFGRMQPLSHLHIQHCAHSTNLVFLDCCNKLLNSLVSWVMHDGLWNLFEFLTCFLPYYAIYSIRYLCHWVPGLLFWSFNQLGLNYYGFVLSSFFQRNTRCCFQQRKWPLNKTLAAQVCMYFQ